MDNNNIFRFDSTYFKKQYLEEENEIRSTGSKKLCDIGAEIKSFGAYSLNNEVEYIDDGIPFIRGVNMKGGRVNFEKVLYISDKAHKLLWKSEVKEGMVLLSMSGTVGDVAIATSSWSYPVNSNQDIAKIDTKGMYNPFCLYVFFLSRFGQNYLRREMRGSVQQHVFLSQIEQLEIPNFSANFEKRVQKLVEHSERIYLESNDCLSEAETTILRALELEQWKASETKSYVRNSKGVFSSGRLDAEHFQEKYYTLNNVLKNLNNGFSTIGELAESITNGVEIRRYKSTGVPYLRVGDIKNLTINEGSVVYVDPELAEKELVKVKLKVGDILVSRSGTLAVTAVVEKEWSHSLISSHLIRVRVKGNYDPYYVALFLSIMPGRMQIQQWSNGGVQPEISQPSLSRIVIPRVSNEVQEKLRKHILLSREKRQQAESLLAIAKRSMEIAIEKTENKAMRYLEESSE